MKTPAGHRPVVDRHFFTIDDLLPLPLRVESERNLLFGKFGSLHGTTPVALGESCAGNSTLKLLEILV